MADDSKMQIMRQVQQEAAMQNARMLVEVHTRSNTCIIVLDYV